VRLAQEESRALKHDYIGTEHLLLGLLREDKGLAARALGSLGIELDRVRVQVTRIVGSGNDEAADQIPFTPRAKRVFELALRESLSLGHNYIGTEHILLGLGRENEGVATRVLLDFDANAEKIRNEVVRLLTVSAGPYIGTSTQPELDPFIRVGASAAVRRLLRGAAARALDDDRSEIDVSDVLLELTRSVDDATVLDAIKRRDIPEEPPEAASN
jgi:ATP-dependent Clp protease ATP-binding subunit ClpA